MNGFHESEWFHKFFEGWVGEQSQHLDELIAAARDHRNGGENGWRPDDGALNRLVSRVIRHYESYYEVKSRFAENHTTKMFNPSWLSSLEDTFLWIGGWRPSAAFHLLFSKSGHHLEARLEQVIHGIQLGDLADLNGNQMDQINTLQREIINEERDITEKLAKQQNKVADSEMVELTAVVSEAIRAGNDEDRRDTGRVETVLAAEKEGLVNILGRADELRLKVLKNVIQILSPSQGVHFLIAAAELHLRVHEWGKCLDGAGVNGRRTPSNN